jgi:hypothetical protein
MEQLIAELVDQTSRSNPTRIEEVQREIQRLQREPIGWQLGITLLNKSNSHLRFYGALTLTVKIRTDWWGGIPIFDAIFDSFQQGLPWNSKWITACRPWCSDSKLCEIHQRVRAKICTTKSLHYPSCILPSFKHILAISCQARIGISMWWSAHRIWEDRWLSKDMEWTPERNLTAAVQCALAKFFLGRRGDQIGPWRCGKVGVLKKSPNSRLADSGKWRIGLRRG